MTAKRIKTFLTMMAVALTCIIATGCSGTSFDVMSTLSITFDGYSGYANHNLENEYDWIDDVNDWYGDTITSAQRNANTKELKKTVTYQVTPSENLSNGDVVTVKAIISSAADGYAFKLESKEMTVTVEGLVSYAASIDEIPENSLSKIKAQAEDSIRANCASWCDDNHLQSSEYIGSYLLISKPGLVSKPHNELYLVYKNAASITGYKRGGDGETLETAEEEYYIYYCLSDIVNLPDGTCSFDLAKGKLASNEVESDYGYYDGFWGATFYNYNGYADLDSMFNEVVTSRIDSYTYENTVA